MKKLMTVATFAILAICIYLHAQQPPSNVSYDGPKDRISWAFQGGILGYGGTIMQTQLGTLSRYSDVIGVGQVVQRTNDHFTVTIDHALVGCTNGAIIKIYACGDFNDSEFMDWELKMFLPTNHSRIVVAAHTNVYSDGWGRMFWDHAEIPEEPDYIREKLSINNYDRMWWHVNRDDGLLLTQFTNVLQAVRFDRNWTNFFYLCRDGANSPSDRVREDSFWDLRDLTGQATPEQFQFILDDPLVDQKHKDWRLSKPELNP